MTMTMSMAAVATSMALAAPAATPVTHGPGAAAEGADRASLILVLPSTAHADVVREGATEPEGTITGEDILELPPGDYRLRIGASHRRGESTRWRRTLSLRPGDLAHLEVKVRQPGWRAIAGIPLSVLGMALFMTGGVMAGRVPPLRFDRTSGTLFGVGLGLFIVSFPLALSRRPRLRVCTHEPHRPELGRPCR